MEDEKRPPLRMTLEGFDELSITYRAQYTWAHGTLIANKQDPPYGCQLYQIEDYFVEVGYNNFTNRIEWIEGFRDTDHLSTYLRNISLNDLF